jgi:colanic acid/amylovoran biosynthesis glycosyltransferase
MSSSTNPCVAILRHQLFLPSEVFIAEQARALRRFAPLLVGRVLGGTPAAGLAFHVPAGGRLAQLNYVLRRDPGLFMHELMERKPVLIHAHFGVEAVYGMELAERLGVPLVTTFHGFDATLRPVELLRSRKPSWIHYLLKRAELKRRGALFIGVSAFILAQLERLGFPTERTRLHYIGVDPAAFESSPAAAAARSDTSPIILHVARLVEKKGTAYLLEAFARIAAQHPDAQLVVIGAGPLQDSLARRAAELRVDARVRWLGAATHAEVAGWLRRAAVFCLPSCTARNGDAEGLGLALLEAAASGVPVVATQHGGIPEAVQDGETGYLVPERDADALADALDTLLSSEQLRRRMGDAARRFARSRFDLQRQTGHLEQLYEGVL